jgi:hypothetical protein
MHRRVAVFALLATMIGTVLAAPAPAAVVPFDAKAFAHAQAAGNSIVVFVHAPW